MEDLSRTVNLLSMSSDLEHAASSLRKGSNSKQLTPRDRNALVWTSQFLRVVDWTSVPAEENVQISGHLTVQATSIRPMFYASIFQVAPAFRAAGFETEKSISDFLSRLYCHLDSLANTAQPNDNFNVHEAKLGYDLLHTMAESLLVQVNNNGLPSPFVGALEA